MSRRALALLLGAWLVLPLPLLALLSVSRYWTYPALWPQRLQASQWQVIAAGSGIPSAFAHSLGMALTVGLLATAAAFVSSRAVAVHARRNALVVLAHLPFAVSPVVLGSSLLYAFIRLGLAGTTAGVIFAQWLFAYAYAVIVLQGFWNDQAHALGDLAATLGARQRQIWRRVWLAQARGLLGVCLFQTFLISWFDYALVAVLGSGRVATLTTKVFDYFGAGDMRLAAACALLLMLPPLLALWLHRGVLARGTAAVPALADA